MLKYMKSAFLFLCIILLFPTHCFAQEAFTNPDTSYRVIVQDDADLLTNEEEKDLIDVMEPITEYGNVAFVTTDYNYSSADSYAKSTYRDMFGTKSGTLFLIDIDNRMIYIFSDGKIYRTITKSYANTITDNVYRYASNKDYYTCAAKAFEQINTLLKGGFILQPMKYISNALLAIILAVMFNYFRILFCHGKAKPTTKQIVDKMNHHVSFDNISNRLLKTERVYHPRSSGGGSSGGGSSSGGGGSSSGGGGGHSF